MEIQRRGGFAHAFKRDHAGFGGLCPFGLLFEIGAVNLRAIGAGEKHADFVAGAVEIVGFALRGAVEEIDEAPSDILAVGFQRSIGEQRKQVRPHPGKRLVDRVLARKIGGSERRRLDGKSGKIEACQLLGKIIVHGFMPPEAVSVSGLSARQRLPTGAQRAGNKGATAPPAGRETSKTRLARATRAAVFAGCG